MPVTTLFSPRVRWVWMIVASVLASGPARGESPEFKVSPRVTSSGELVSVFLPPTYDGVPLEGPFAVEVNGRGAHVVEVNKGSIVVEVPRNLEGTSDVTIVTPIQSITIPNALWIETTSILSGPTVAWVAAGVAALTMLLGYMGHRLTSTRSRAELQTLERTLDHYRESREGVAAGSIEMLAPGSGQPPVIPDELVSVCSSGECVLFAGEDLATQAGYPTWGEAITELVARLSKQDPQADWRSVEEALLAGRLSSVAEVLATRVPRETIVTGLREIYSDFNSLAGRHSTSSSLKELQRVPFAKILTTTVSPTMEQIFPSDPTNPSRKTEVVTPSRPDSYWHVIEDTFCVVKLKGGLDGPDDAALSADEYRLMMTDRTSFTRHLASLAMSRPHVFVGADLATIEEHFSVIRAQGPGTHEHFAILPEQDGVALDRERLAAKYGVRVITYRPSLGRPELAEGLRTLANRVSSELPHPRKARPVQGRSGPTLTAVGLTNIGPFSELGFELQQNWNVLLGNNGCGKSTILRAIALGLCGDDPKILTMASRLLKVGETRGEIVLTIGRDKYHTELQREGNNVRVSTRHLTPLQLGRWVVLAFPPLRAVPGENPAGPTPDGSSEPTIEDILPLLEGPTDHRLRNVKQWIVNLDMRARDRRSTSAQIERSQQLLQRFFEILNCFTPGTTFEHVPVDESNWSVKVKTRDGTIPIEQVSQGTSSIIGWVGTLLQRMYEIYESPHPEKESALVLVDEVDAHLHPAWQQVLVSHVRALFPGLQMVATTHSPLIVSGMSREEVFVVRRSDDPESVIELTQLPADFEGLRADQILTSPLFGLSSTRGGATRAGIARYAELIGKSPRTNEEDAELARLQERLDRVLGGGETESERLAERRAERLLEQVASPEHLVDSADPQVREEATRQLNELFEKGRSGS